jgi:hypothetical protein
LGKTSRSVKGLPGAAKFYINYLAAMKELVVSLLPLLCVLILGSCQPNQNQQTADANQPPADSAQGAKTAGSPVVERWKLTRVVHTSMIAGKADTSSAPPYQETIELRADSTFRRFRSNGYEATGKYTTRRFGPDDQGFLATFDDPKLSYHELSGTRQNAATEGEVYLRQQGPDVLVESYVAADGPTFYYEKVKERE